MIPTLFGVMLLTFVVTQFVPGGPVEQLLAEMEGLGKGGEVAGSTSFYRGIQGSMRPGWHSSKSFMDLTSHP